MKYSRSAITQLTKWYKQVLIKCALLNAAIFVSVGGLATNANAAMPTPTNGDDAAYTWKTSGANTGIKVNVDETDYYVDIKKTGYTDASGAQTLNYSWDDTTKQLTVTNSGEPVKTDGVEYVGNTGTWGGAGNYSSGIVDAIAGDFVGNSVTKEGGAIYATGSSQINGITGNFIGNRSNSGSFGGGAIFHNSSNSIGTITGDFIGNYAAYKGGAILNTGNTNINSITGDFIGNKAAGNGIGGAIYNYVGRFSSISGNFIANSANQGGAIFNESQGKFDNITGDFIGNSATKNGGAIYTSGYNTYDYTLEGYTNFVDSSFINNTAEQGAAIYANAGKVRVTAKNKNIEFTNNIATGSGTKEGYGIYLTAYTNFDYGVSSVLELNANSGKKITINDTIYSKNVGCPNDGKVVINNDPNYNSGTVIFNNKFDIDRMEIYGGTTVFGTGTAATSLTKAQYLEVYGGTLSIANNNIDTLVFGEITDQNSFNLAIDVDATDGAVKADKITAYAYNSNPIYLSVLNFINDSADYGDIQISEGNIKDKIALANNIDSGIYTTVSYDSSNGILSFADPVSWTKRTLGTDSAYRWTKNNTGIMPVDWTIGDTPTTLYVDILKKTYTDSEGEQTLTYAWEESTRRFSVTPGGTAIKTDGVEYVGNSASDGAALKNPESASGWFIGNTAAHFGGAIYNSGTMSTINGYFIANNSDYVNDGGGAIYNSGNITTVTGDFIGNFASRYGGAIYNTGTITDTIGDFIGNYASTGGAVTNFGTMTNISGNFINNGGGQYNSYSSIYNRGTIENLNANFIGNASDPNNSSDATVYNQGTINSISGDFIGNKGGVIRNYSDDWNLFYASVGSIEGNFIDNAGTVISNSAREATVNMGSISGLFRGNNRGIYLSATTMTGNISGTFENNGIMQDYYYGGAISIDSVSIDTSISGIFTGNKSTQGGAIHNYSYSGNNYVASISGTFTNNEANYGGAIENNYAKINSLSGTFTGNSATNAGGAIYNAQKGLVNIYDSTFSGNSSAKGGAIFNFTSSNYSYPTVNIYDSSFIGNIASEQGAAIYSGANTGSYQCTNNCYAIVKVTAQNSDIEFTNNNSTGTAEGTGYGIYVDNGTFNLNADTGRKIVINDRVYSSPEININTGDTNNSGTVEFNNSMSGNWGVASFDLGGGTVKLGHAAANSEFGLLNFTNTPTFDLQNGYADTTCVNQIIGNATLKIDANVDGENITPDTLYLTSSGNTGTLTIDSLNIIGETPDTFTLNILKGYYYDYFANLNLAMSDTLAEQYNTDPAWENYTKYHTYENSISFDKTAFTDENRKRYANKQLSIVVNNDEYNGSKSLKLDMNVLQDDFVSVKNSYDALKVLNEHTGDRTMSAVAATADTYTVTDDLGETAEGSFTIRGKSAGTSTLDMNNHSGFELANDDTSLNLYNLNITNVKDVDGGLINIGNGNYSRSVYFENVTMNTPTTNAVILNSDYMYFSGTNLIKSKIGNSTNQGNIYIYGGKTTLSGVEQRSLSVDYSGAELNIEGGDTAASIYLGSGTTANFIDSSIKSDINTPGEAILSVHYDSILNVTAQTKDVEITNPNTSGISSYGYSSSKPTFKFNANTGKTLTINDNVDASYATVYINSDENYNGGTVEFNGGLNLGYRTLNLAGGTLKLGTSAANTNFGGMKVSNTATLDLQNGAAQNTGLDTISMTSADELKLKVDYDGSTGSMDKLILEGGSGKITLDAIKVIADGEATSTRYLSGAAKNSITVVSEAIVAATEGWRYTFTPSATDNGLLNITREKLNFNLATAIADATVSSYTMGSDFTFDENGQGTLAGDGRNFTIFGQNHVIAGGGTSSYIKTSSGQTLNIENATFQNMYPAISNQGNLNLKNVLFAAQDYIDVINNGTLNLDGTNTVNYIAWDNDNPSKIVNVNSGTTTVRQAIYYQSELNVAEGATLILGNGYSSIQTAFDNKGTVEVANRLILNGADMKNSGTINGDGEVQIYNDGDGTAYMENTGTMNNVLVSTKGTLKTAAENINGTLKSNGTLLLSGTLNKDIEAVDPSSATGMIKIDGTLKIDASGAEGNTIYTNHNVFDLNNGTLDMKNGKIDTLRVNFNNATGAGNLALDIDLSGETVANDVFSAAGVGIGCNDTVTVSDLNLIGTLKPFEAQILKGDIQNRKLLLSDSVAAQYNKTDTKTRYESDDLTATASWNDTFNTRKYETVTTKKLETYSAVATVENHNSLRYTETTGPETLVEETTEGDTLALLNKTTQFGATERKFVTSDASATHNVSEDLGTTAAGKLTVQGATDGENTSTIDLKGKKGFEVGEGAEVVLDTVKITGAKAANGALINNESGTVTLKDVEVAENSKAAINNGSTMNLSGTNNIKSGIDGDGTTNITDGETKVASKLVQKKLNIKSGATLEANADNIDAPVANNGTYDVTGGTIGKDVTGNGATVIKGNVQNKAKVANDITVNAGKSLTSNADNIGGNVTSDGTYNVTGGTINNKVAGGALKVKGDVTVGDKADVKTASANVAKGASLDVGTNSVDLGDVTIDGTVKLEITDIAAGSDKYSGGQINATSLNLGKDSKLSLTVAPNLIAKKTSTGALDIINVSGATTGEFAEMMSNNRYKLTADKDGKFVITNFASVADIINEAGGSGNNISTGETWDETTFAAGSKAAEVQGVLNELSQHDEKGYVKALTDLAPSDSMAHVGLTQDFNNLVSEQIEARQQQKGLSSGDMFVKRGAWIQMLYNHSKQDKNDKNQGFTGKTKGVALGLDGEISDKTTVGIGYAYGKTDVDSAGRDMDVNGHTVYVYGKYQPSAWYVRGLAHYGFAEYEEKANISGIANKAEYDVHNYGARAFVGYDLPNGFTPEAGLRITRIERRNYTDSIGQHVKTDGIEVLTASMGMNYSTTVSTKDQTWSPKAHVALTYDILSDDSNATVKVGNGIYNVEGKKLNRFGVEGGVGIEYGIGNWELSAEYDLGARKDYLSHTGMLKAKYNF